MNVSELLDENEYLIDSMMELRSKNNISFSSLADMKVLKPSATNNDVNGSQHHDFIVDFTYVEATREDAYSISNLGYYEYFGEIGDGKYTGHYYEGNSYKIEAIVIDPPEYAIDVEV